MSSPYINHFLQPDTLIPDPSNPQAWNRYSYVVNNPVNFNDPSGHCFDGITTVFCVAVIGGVISLAVDAYVTTQINHEEYTWERAAIAFGIGALGGVIAATIIVPAAAAFGAWAGATIAVPAALSPAVAATAELTAGMFMAGTTNSGLSTAKRMALDMLDGEEITKDKIVNDIQENWDEDMLYGAAGYGVGYGLSRLGSAFWSASDEVAPLLHPHPIQKIVIGAGQATSQALGNSDLQSLLEKKLSRYED